MKTKISLIFLILALNIFLISAANPHILQSTHNGYEIEFVSPFELRQGTTFNFDFHVYNSSNGYPVIDNNTRCDFHIYNASGNHIASYQQSAHEPLLGFTNEWQFTPNESNFSSVGIHHFIFQCNNTLRSLGGWISDDITVTSSGFSIDTPTSISSFLLYIGLLLMAVIFFGLAIVFRSRKTIFVSLFFMSIGIMIMVIGFGLIMNFINRFTEDFGYVSPIYNNLYYLITLLLIVGGFAIVIALLVDSLNKFKSIRYGDAPS